MMLTDCYIKIHHLLKYMYIEMSIDYVKKIIFHVPLIRYAEYSSGPGKEHIKVRI